MENKDMSKTRKWVLACRPKTLSAAVAPVVVATSMAWADGRMRWGVAVLCALFAVAMQIAANLINDVMDFSRGTDGDDRLGPPRACAQGWLTKRECWSGVAVALSVAAVLGIVVLISSGAWIDWSDDALGIDWAAVGWLVGLGLACGVFAFLYTSLLSYLGGGDLLVYIFFGFVPVLGTYYVQALQLTASVWWMGAAMGLVVDTLLLLNNYRDRDTDRRTGKHTLVAVFGEHFGSVSYLLHGILGAACALVAIGSEKNMLSGCVLMLCYVMLHLPTWRAMTKIHSGRKLNRVLGITSRNILLFALFATLAVVSTRVI